MKLKDWIEVLLMGIMLSATAWACGVAIAGGMVV
jgi:hypothetical protein